MALFGLVQFQAVGLVVKDKLIINLLLLESIMRVNSKQLKEGYRIIGSSFDHAGHMVSLVQSKKTHECYIIRIDTGQSEDEYILKSTAC